MDNVLELLKKSGGCIGNGEEKWLDEMGVV